MGTTRKCLLLVVMLATLSSGCVASFSAHIQGPSIGGRQFVIINNNLDLWLEADAEGIHYKPVGDAGDTVRVPLPYFWDNNQPPPRRTITVKAYLKDGSGNKGQFVGQDTQYFSPTYGQGNQFWTVDNIREVRKYRR